ncbi:hypothetical protein Barb7_03042 [Bacteroidales bacterium Barb7]|nr:hypothetical protein Barb7_03042 [Bacteroidales bacterium Barb7]
MTLLRLKLKFPVTSTCQSALTLLWIPASASSPLLSTRAIFSSGNVRPVNKGTEAFLGARMSSRLLKK